MDDIERSGMSLATLDDSDATNVVASRDHTEISLLEFDEIRRGLGVDVELDRVVDLDVGVRVADGASVVGGDRGDSLASGVDAHHLQKLVIRLLGADSVDSEASLDVVEKAEVISRPLDLDGVHESSRVVHVRSDLSIDLDEPLSHNQSNLASGQGVLEPVSEEEDEWQALARLVGSGAWFRGLVV